jgi:hypothetical protein
MYVTLEPTHNTNFPGTENQNHNSQASGVVSIDKFRDAETSYAISPSHNFPSLSFDLYINTSADRSVNYSFQK